MSRVERLARNFERLVSLPWDRTLAGPQKIWMVVYDKTEERRLRAEITEFEIAARNSGHSWITCDMTDVFAQWLAGQEYKEAYFESPEDLELAYPEFAFHCAKLLADVLTSDAANDDTIAGLTGTGALFPFVRVSDLISAAASKIRGRLVVFFPGEYENNNYRLLDARDGWNYHVIPITEHEEAHEK